eukprot:gene12027-5426_t
MEAPTTTDAVTAEYLNEVLKNHLQGQKIIKVEKKATGVKGNMCDSALIHLTYEEGTKPKIPSVYIKFIMLGNAWLNKEENKMNFVRETNFYNDIKKYITTEKGDKMILYPEPLYITISLNDKQEVEAAFIILENACDENGLGFVSGNHANPLEPDYVEDILLQLSKYHAVFWTDKKPGNNSNLLDKKEFDFIKHHYEKEYIEDQLAKYDNMLQTIKDFEFLFTTKEREKPRVIFYIKGQEDQYLPDEIFSTYDKVASNMKNIIEMIKKCPSYSLIHGDLRCDNMLIKPLERRDESGHKVMSVDWQTYVRAPPAFDVAYVLFTSTDAKYRSKKDVMKFLKYYYENLVQSGVKDFTFEQLIYEFKLSLIWAWLFLMLFTIPFVKQRYDAEEDKEKFEMYAPLPRKAFLLGGFELIKEFGALDIFDETK